MDKQGTSISEKKFKLQELAKLTNSSLVGDGEHFIQNVADLETAGEFDASFLANPNYDKAMRSSLAGVVFVSPSIELMPGRNFLITADPSRAFQMTVEALFGKEMNVFSGFTDIHPSAIIHETAIIGSNVTIGPHAVIDKDVVVKDNTTISAGCYIGFQANIGTNCLLHPGVIVRERSQIGNRVIIQPGAVIGSCGFGYTTDQQGRHQKLNQVGIVVIEDDVEIGANTTIDRSRFKSTVIGQGSKIDNLVQIGHGVVIGKHTIIIAHVGIAGSTTIGNHVVIAGHVAVAGHLKIASKTIIAGKSGVSKSITVAGKYNGLPAMPVKEYNRNSVYLRNIETYVQQIKELQEKVKILEKLSN